MIKNGDLVIAADQSNDAKYRVWQKLSIYAKAKAECLPLSHPDTNKTYIIIDNFCIEMISFIEKYHLYKTLVGIKFVKCLSNDGLCYIFPASSLQICR